MFLVRSKGSIKFNETHKLGEGREVKDTGNVQCKKSGFVNPVTCRLRSLNYGAFTEV